MSAAFHCLCLLLINLLKRLREIVQGCSLYSKYIIYIKLFYGRASKQVGDYIVLGCTQNSHSSFCPNFLHLMVHYPTPAALHVLGYIAENTKPKQKKPNQTQKNHSPPAFIGPLYYTACMHYTSPEVQQNHEATRL